MEGKTTRTFGPSRENEIRYSRTYVMFLVPLAVLLTILWGAALWVLIAGLLSGEANRIIGGGFFVTGGAVVLGISWWNAARALRDRRIQQRQLQERR